MSAAKPRRRGNRPRPVPCICPHALALLAASAPQRPAGLPPWSNGHEVLPECPAPTHNSLSAARPYRKHGRPKPPACVCPEALRKLEEYREHDLQRSLDRLRAARSERAEEMRIKVSTVRERKARIPFDYTGGLCTTPAGQRIADYGFNLNVTLGGIESRGRAKAQCRMCPIQKGCLSSIRFEEGDDPGSMDGVYGGLDPFERQGRRLVWNSAEGRVEEFPMPLDRWVTA